MNEITCTYTDCGKTFTPISPDQKYCPHCARNFRCKASAARVNAGKGKRKANRPTLCRTKKSLALSEEFKAPTRTVKTAWQRLCEEEEPPGCGFYTYDFGARPQPARG